MNKFMFPSILHRVPGRVTALLVVAGLAQAAWAAAPADTLVLGKAADPQNLDPAITMDNNDWTLTYPSYQRLIRYKVEKGKGSTNVEGDLAASWKASKDNLTWEFKLRAGQISLHDDNIIHGSGPNTMGQWRMGLTIRYSATEVHDTNSTPQKPFLTYLVRGQDSYKHINHLQGTIPTERFARRELRRDSTQRR